MAPPGGGCSPPPGRDPQRPLWASTGVKDPAYPDTLYVTDLVAPDTVNTMPGEDPAGVRRPRQVTGDTVTGTYAEAQQVFDGLAGASASTTTTLLEALEDEGVQKFEASWQELLDTVKGQLDAAK